MINSIRKILRKNSIWIEFQEINREGYLNFLKRIKIQKKILKTPPYYTDSTGDVEVRVLSWRRDAVNVIWSLKSFYYFSKKKYPLKIHDGGLLPSQIKLLKKHFPNAEIIPRVKADCLVEDYLSKNGYLRSLQYRKDNIATLKLFDYFLLSDAKEIIHIDSDVIFLSSPDEIVKSNKKSIFNKDFAEAYSMSREKMNKAFGIMPPSLINSGLFRVKTESIKFDKIESWLNNDELYKNKWVTEQTLHALAATEYGVELLDEKKYLIGVTKGNMEGLTMKHYTGFFRPYFYQEGLNYFVIKNWDNFLNFSPSNQL